MSTPYERDLVAWAGEQAALLRARDFSALDLEHVAEEVEDLGKSDRRELASRTAGLLANLLKWRVQPERRGGSWRRTIAFQREEIDDLLGELPSLRPRLADPDWLSRVWDKATKLVAAEIDVDRDTLPGACPWTIDQVVDPAFLPD